MAEFNFYGTEQDWDVLLEVVFSHSELYVIPDVFHPTAKATYYRQDSKNFRQALEVKRGLFIKGPFTERDAVLRRTGKLGYYVDVVSLGPLLSLFLPSNEVSSDGVLLRPGWLSHQSEYWLEDCSASLRPSPELRVAYANLKKEFERRLVPEKISGRVWIGKQALQELRTGQATILIRGKWWKFSDGVPKLEAREGL